jgi:flagellar basal body-associated protein FliL
MVTSLPLLDIGTDPVGNPLTGVGLVLIAIIVLMLTAATVIGFVFLLRWLRRQPPSNAVAGTSQPVPQFQPSNPNQP